MQKEGGVKRVNRVRIDRIKFVTELALVGDQKHGTNVEAPLDTIRQASEEAVLNVLSKLGITGGLGNNSQTMVAKLYLDGHQVTEAVIKDGMVQQMATGNNPFLLGTI